MQFKTKWVIACLLLLLAPSLSLAKSAKTLRSEHPWSTYQGNSQHTGYVPVFLANPDLADADTTNDPELLWNVNDHYTPPFLSECWEVGADRWWREYGIDLVYSFGSVCSSWWLDSDASGSSPAVYMNVEPLLNQVTISENMVLITNKGYKVPHVVWARDAEDFGKISSQYAYDRSFDLDYLRDPYNGFYPDFYCPVSQSQPSISDTFLMHIQTNVFDISYSERFLCGLDPDLAPIQTRTHFRTFPFQYNKGPEGTELFHFNVEDFLQIPVRANQWDSFSAPAPYRDEVYFLGGGTPGTREDAGMYAYSIDPLAPLNLNIGENFSVTKRNPNATKLSTDYYPLAPNDLFSPAVSGDYVITYTQYQLDADAPDFNPFRENLNPDLALGVVDELSYEEEDGAILSVINRHTGESFEYEDIHFAPKLFPYRPDEYSETELRNVFHMERSPVIFENSVLVTADEIVSGEDNQVKRGYIRSYRITDNDAGAGSGAATGVGRGFVGQVSVSSNRGDPSALPIVYGMANNRLVGRYINNSGPVDQFTVLMDTVDTDNPVEWYWEPPNEDIPDRDDEPPEQIYPPFVVTDTHIFVSTDRHVYMVDLDLSVPLANRTVMVISEEIENLDDAGEDFTWELNPSYLSLNYNRLVIATSTSYTNSRREAEALVDQLIAEGRENVSLNGRQINRPINTSNTLTGLFNEDTNSRVIAIDFPLSVAYGADVGVQLVNIDTNDIPTGDSITYTFEVTNDGPDSATDVRVYSRRPLGLKYQTFSITSNGTNIDSSKTCGFYGTGNANFECTIATLSDSEIATFEISGVGLSTDLITFVISAEPDEVDAARDNNSASQTNSGAVGQQSANLVLAASLDQEEAVQGDVLTLSLTGYNEKESMLDAEAPRFEVVLGTHFEFVGVVEGTANGVTCSSDVIPNQGPSVICGMEAGEELSNDETEIGVDIQLRLNDPDPTTQELAVIQVEFESESTFDIAPDNNVEGVTVVSNRSPSIQSTLAHSARSDLSVGINDQITVSFSMANTGGQVTGGTFTAVAAGGLAMAENSISSSWSSSNCTLSSTQITCTDISLSDSGSIDFGVNANTAGSGSVQVFFDGDQLQPSSSEDGINDSLSFVIVQPVDIAVSLGSMNRNLNVGDYTTFPLTIANGSAADAESVTVAAQFPVSLAVTNTTSSSCSSVSNQLQCNLGTITAGSSTTLNVQIQAEDSSNTSPITFSIATSSVENSTDLENNSVTSESIVVFAESPTGSGAVNPWWLFAWAALILRLVFQRKVIRANTYRG